MFVKTYVFPVPALDIGKLPLNKVHSFRHSFFVYIITVFKFHTYRIQQAASILIMDILKPDDYIKASETCNPYIETHNFNTEHHCVEKKKYIDSRRLFEAV
jgi:hypothetical protein